MVLKGKKWSQNVQYGLKWSSMFPNGPKWSKKIDHKFNRMAFITRFNLVLVWSKIVKMLTKKSSYGSGITRSPGLVSTSSETKDYYYFMTTSFYIKSDTNSLVGANLFVIWSPVIYVGNNMWGVQCNKCMLGMSDMGWR